jgi:hypothetical protein
VRATGRLLGWHARTFLGRGPAIGIHASSVCVRYN